MEEDDELEMAETGAAVDAGADTGGGTGADRRKSVRLAADLAGMESTELVAKYSIASSADMKHRYKG